MKNILLLALIMFAVFMVSCDDEKKPTQNTGDFYVKIKNADNSEFPISSIKYQSLGAVIEGKNPQGDWSSNLLGSGELIQPGQHKFYYLDIPSKHWAECAIGVMTDNGQVILREQENFNDWILCSITHWGGDTRTIEISIMKNASGVIEIVGWSDWSGID